MTTAGKKAIGIDISKTAVSFAELQKKGSQMIVCRYGILPLEGNGNDISQNLATLTKTLKKFKIAKTFQHSDAVVTICSEPVLLQILNLPDAAPAEVKKIIQSEVRQYAVLPLKNIVMDYCGLRSADAETKRVLVGAGQGEYLTSTVRAVEKSSISVKAVEPAISAFIRACFNKVIRQAGRKNIMVLLLRDDTLNLCVFEKQKLEFLRTKKFDALSAASGNLIKTEIESVLQFYELEKDTKAQSWQIIIAGCPDNGESAGIAEEIKSQITRQDIEIIPFENSMIDAEIKTKEDIEISSVAVGAAMKLLDEGVSGIKLNLLPGEILLDRGAQKELLAITNIAACVLLCMLIIVALLTKKSIRAESDIYAAKYKPKIDVAALVQTKQAIDEKIRLIEQNSSTIERLVENKNYNNWAKLLVELSKTVPKTVLVENMQSKEDGTIIIEGLAVNYESANKFVKLLGKSKNVKSASLISAGQSAKFGGSLVDYSILCSLAK